MKIKIIDLLNNIALKKDIPKKIKWKNEVLSYDEDTEDYYGLSTTDDAFLAYLFNNNPTGSFLLDYVEILDSSEIDINKISIFNDEFLDYYKNEISPVDKEIIEKVNSLILAVKQLDTNKNFKINLLDSADIQFLKEKGQIL